MSYPVLSTPHILARLSPSSPTARRFPPGSGCKVRWRTGQTMNGGYEPTTRGKIERRAAPCCRFFVCLSILPWDNIEPRTWQKNSIYERLIIELIWRFHKDNSLPKDYFLLTVLLLPFPSVRVSVLSLQSFPRLSRYGRSEGMEWVNDGRNEERTEWREWEETTNDHPTGHLLSVIPLPLMSVLTLPTSFLCSLSLLSRSLRLEVRFSLFTSHLSSDSEPRSGEQRRWVDRRRTDPRKLRQVVRILGLEVRLNGHEI